MRRYGTAVLGARRDPESRLNQEGMPPALAPAWLGSGDPHTPQDKPSPKRLVEQKFYYYA